MRGVATLRSMPQYCYQFFWQAKAAGLDFTAFSQQRSVLQDAADAAALAAVKEASLLGWSEKVANSVAASVLDTNLQESDLKLAAYTATAKVDVDARRVEVVVTQDHYPYFSKAFFPSPQISVKAAATSAGSANICVIGLNENDAGVIGLNDDAN
ncbi:MAG: hypothetical protein U5K75_10770 [Ahrensia sp.]|nr:hypothetical protein [Ahrensia sp.]